VAESAPSQLLERHHLVPLLGLRRPASGWAPLSLLLDVDLWQVSSFILCVCLLLRPKDEQYKLIELAHLY
jgi:hypothetical protein